MTQQGSNAFARQLRILIIDDSGADAELIQHALRKGGISAFFKRVCTADDMRQEIDDSRWDLILCDCHMPRFSAEAALRMWREKGEDVPFIILSGAIGEEEAVDLLKAGAHDFIRKDNFSRLIPAIERELREAGERKRSRQYQKDLKNANDELLAINRIIMACSSSLDVRIIFDRIMDEVLRITGLEGGTICLVNPDKTLELAAHRVTSEATIQDLTTNSVRIGECLCGECARDRTPLILPDREAVLQYATRETTRGEDIRFHAAFPLITADTCVGVLCVFSRTDQKPLHRSLKLLETVSAQIALAIDNARLYAESVQHGATLEDKVAERTADIERAQKALLNLLDDVNKTKNDLEQANNRLKELDRLKSMFIASMSHELRTPLNSIIGFTGIILQGLAGSINAEQKDQLERVFSSGKHLLALINDVIDVSKIEAGRVDVHLSECSLVAVIVEAASSFQQMIQKKGLMLEVTAPANIRITTDRRRFFQCIMNYLSNAVKYSRKGTIRIEATETNNSIMIRVRDMGIGISTEDLPKLFNSFVRLDSELKIQEAGTGLGLYLTRKIVTELLGGSVSAESVLGVGSIFSLSIPVKLECAMEVS